MPRTSQERHGVFFGNLGGGLDQEVVDLLGFLGQLQAVAIKRGEALGPLDVSRLLLLGDLVLGAGLFKKVGLVFEDPEVFQGVAEQAVCLGVVGSQFDQLAGEHFRRSGTAGEAEFQLD